MNTYTQDYYVYFYLCEDFTPYYVGKGKTNRAWKTRKSIKLPKNNIVLIEQNLTELQAFILERYYIRWFGRKDIGTGILRNRTDGGEGTSGKIILESTKEKISNSNKGKSKKPKPKECFLKHSQVMKNMWADENSIFRSKETKQKFSQSKKKDWENNTYQNNKIKQLNNFWENENSLLYKSNTKTYKIFAPKDSKIEPFVIRNLSKFCRENGLVGSCMRRVANKKQDNHKGWRCEEINYEDFIL